MIMIPNEDVIRKAAPHFLEAAGHILDKKNPAFISLAAQLFLGCQACMSGFPNLKKDVEQVFTHVRNTSD